MSDPELRAHQDWLGFLQPTGLLVSPQALVQNGVFADRNVVSQQQVLQQLLAEPERPGRRDRDPQPGPLRDFTRLCTDLLGWEAADLAGAEGAPPVPSELEVALPEYGERLAPTYAVFDPDAKPDAPLAERTLLLIQQLPGDTNFDTPAAHSERGWHASPQARLERLLRETGVAQGLLVNELALRLVYAPRGESSGFGTFRFAALAQVAGRPLLSALLMLLRAERLFTVGQKQRLHNLLVESRRYQNHVSTRLAEQVLDALWELMRGFQAADAATQGKLLGPVLAADPNEIYGGLLTTLLRLVFLLYAEDRSLMSADPVYVQYYSVTGLFEKLRDDAGRNPDTMDQRYGAWPQLLALFRLVFDGGAHAALRLPARRGNLFDPDAYPFLEGREPDSTWRKAGLLAPPRVADGVVWRVLDQLLVLDGERLSYRALDVEQIGSVYETVMGFRLERARGAAIGTRPKHVVADLDALLATAPKDRAKRLADETECKLTGGALEALRQAETLDALVAALGRRVSPHMPRILPHGALYLQPTEERRRSGSHYTPRSLTEPIVRTTLQPLLNALGPSPKAEAILSLRVCDLAMGSGAFLVEACRFLGDALVAAWQVHGNTPEIPLDEDPQLFARRLVAQRCLYGVDKNLFAVDLAKLSLWLATLAKEHPFTFVDHALRCGDSLLGLSRAQIAGFHWEPDRQVGSIERLLTPHLKTAERLREEIQSLAASDDTEAKTKLLAEADATLENLRLVGDLVVAAFVGGERPKEREKLRSKLEGAVELWLGGRGDRDALAELAAKLRTRDHSVLPFHWEVEFPEVFSRAPAGFDAFVGNPPFLGGHMISGAFGSTYLDYLLFSFPPAAHYCDLVAYFFRRAFALLHPHGALGLIATKTIAQGDTRNGALTPICQRGGRIFAASKRLRWPGNATVNVSVVHIAREQLETGKPMLDCQPAPRISAFLNTGAHDEDPARLGGINSLFSKGSQIYGQGFLFDDQDSKAWPLEHRAELLRARPEYAERILPYIGGHEVNTHPRHLHHRWVIFLSDLENEAEVEHRFPELADLVRRSVKPERDRLPSNPSNIPLKRRWWAYQAHRPDFYARCASLSRVLAIPNVTEANAFVFLATGMIYSQQLVLFLFDQYSAFSMLQSRTHELWAKMFASSLGDTLRYTPSDCFETFPFPDSWELKAPLETAGRTYYEYRAALMIENDEGLTRTYNRFHEPDEASPAIVRLRELHDAMDRAVLDAYGWADLRPECNYLLDYEEEDETEDDGRTRRRKKPWRYRWPDELRDEVLARLLALNRERAAVEQRSGTAAEVKKAGKGTRLRATRKATAPPGVGPLFDRDSD